MKTKGNYPLVRLSACECGFSFMPDGTEVGDYIGINPSGIAYGEIQCAGCKKHVLVSLLKTLDQNDGPEGYLPAVLFGIDVPEYQLPSMATMWAHYKQAYHENDTPEEELPALRAFMAGQIGLLKNIHDAVGANTHNLGALVVPMAKLMVESHNFALSQISKETLTSLEGLLKRPIGAVTDQSDDTSVE